MPTTYCSPSGLIHSCSVVYRRSAGFSPAPTAKKLVLLLVRLHFGAWPRMVWHKWQRDHLGRGRFAAHLDGQLAADIAQPDRYVAHRDVLRERRRERSAANAADGFGIVQDRKFGSRHTARRHAQADQSARRPDRLDLHQRVATHE